MNRSGPVPAGPIGHPDGDRTTAPGPAIRRCPRRSDSCLTAPAIVATMLRHLGLSQQGRDATVGEGRAVGACLG